MSFDELDSRLRIYETAHDHCVLPGLFMVARLDGRGFTRLTRELHDFEAPFDERFRDFMVATTQHLMQIGLRVKYGYTQSDEISLVLHRDESSFGRKLRKLCSVLAGEASARFSLLLGDVAAFDCRISQLPARELVVEYLQWRAADAHRNALSAHCYWSLRRAGRSPREADAIASGLSASEKNELLFQEAGINFNEVPVWQRRGVGLFREDYEREGRNPITGASTVAVRRRLAATFELPMGDDYSAMVNGILDREA